MQWRHLTVLWIKKFKSQALTGEVILTVFFDIKGPLFLDCKSCSDTVSANCYCHVPQQLHTKIKRNFWDELTDDTILLHINAHPHIVQRVQDQVNGTGVGRGHTHTSSCNFYIFRPFKKALKGHTFTRLTVCTSLQYSGSGSRPKSSLQMEYASFASMALQSNACDDIFLQYLQQSASSDKLQLYMPYILNISKWPGTVSELRFSWQTQG